jgi:flagellar biosynthesis/type III secretory pathway chaperone
MSELTPSNDEHHAQEAALVAGSEAASRLGEILSLEFESLKTRDLAAFEAFQEEKTELLQGLASLAEWASSQNPMPVLWQQMQESLQQSKQDHLRNIQLLQRQLQAVKGTLQALQGDSAPSVDLYNRMGQIARRQGAWGQQLA